MSTHANRVKMTVTSVASSGTGDITLNAASTGFRSFATAYGANATVDILITEGTTWEIARNCTYTHSGTTVSRGTLENSSTGSAVAFTSAAVVSVIATAAFGNEIETLIDNGRFSAVAAAGSANSGTLTANAWTQVTATQLNSEVTDSMGWYDAANAKYTPLRAGYYLIGGLALASNVADTKKVLVGVIKNGATGTNSSIYTLSRGVQSGTGGTVIGFGGSQLIYMNGSTDYAELYLQSETGSPAIIVGNYDNSALFWGYYVGA